MAGYGGTSLNIQWLQGAGTTVLSGDFLTLTYDSSVDMKEETAGADTNKQYIAFQKDGKLTIAGNIQSGTAAGGTVMLSTMTEGNFGTIIFSPEGTAASKPKYTVPAYSEGPKLDYAYSDLSKWTCDFQQSGTRVEGTN